MTVFRPFRGLRYHPPALGGLLDAILCPPYDMIGPELKAALQQRSPYNAVHLEGGEKPDPVNPAAGYQQAAALFQRWQTAGILRRDAPPAFYLMRHSYRHQEQERAQLGLFGAVMVEDYDGGSVLPHEFTREPAVRDRVALLQAAQTQFSPLMTLYRDAAGELRPIFDQVMTAPPALETPPIPDSNIGALNLWPIADPAMQQTITAFFADRPVFLADGHHRYEAARRYRQAQEQTANAASPDAAGNYVMMSLTEFDDPGLLLLPYHKLIGGLSPEQLTALPQRLLELFDPEPLDPTVSPAQLAQQVIDRGPGRHTVGILGPGDTPPQLLTLKPEIDWQRWGRLAVSTAWLLDEQVIQPLLGDTAQYVDYSHDPAQAAQLIAAGRRQIAFLLKPFPMDAFESIVSGGQRLPSKSTFFYPKLPTGLLLHRLDGVL